MKVIKQDGTVIRVEMSVAEVEKLLLEAIEARLGNALPELKQTTLEDGICILFESFEPKISYSEVEI